MKVKQIITKYLKDNGYDGLCYENCGCALDDLIPCRGDRIHIDDCVSGYEWDCMKCDDECGNMGQCIKPTKQPPKKGEE
jgi:hypothetical protein